MAARHNVEVRTRGELTAALQAAQPGDTIAVAPGNYGGGHFFTDLHGRDDAPIILKALDQKNQPVFDFDGAAGDLLHFSRVTHLEVRDLILQNAQGNALNIDDGGPTNPQTSDITIDGLSIRDLGDGNHDGVKLSGVDHFRVTNSTIERWGTGGSGIDMVGCHDGVIEGNTVRFVSTASGNGLEAKGGSRDIIVRGNRFENAAARAVQIGGSTGRSLFRPPASTLDYEAADVTVERNVIVGGQAAVAFINSSGGTAKYNTMFRPADYAFRILRESTDRGFAPTHGGTVERNIIAFGPGTYQINAGAGTEPRSFRFAENWWFNADNPANSKPEMPSTESAGVSGTDPRFRDPAKGDFRTKDGSPAAGYGAFAPTSGEPN